MRMMTMACAAVMASAWAGAAGTQTLETAAAGRHAALAWAQEEVSRILGEEGKKTGVGIVLSTLYQRLFALQDQRKAAILALAASDRSIRRSLLEFRHYGADNEIDRRLKSLTDPEIVAELKRIHYPYAGSLEEVRREAFAREALEDEKALVDEGILQVEAQIKSLLERLFAQAGK